MCSNAKTFAENASQFAVVEGKHLYYAISGSGESTLLLLHGNNVYRRAQNLFLKGHVVLMCL